MLFLRVVSSRSVAVGRQAKGESCSLCHGLRRPAVQKRVFVEKAPRLAMCRLEHCYVLFVGISYQNIFTAGLEMPMTDFIATRVV